MHAGDTDAADDDDA